MSEYNNENIFSKRLRAGKRRTYFFDVRTTKNNDYFVTLTESKKRFDGEGFDRHKIFLYKEDFNKFIDALNETINHVKTELMPDFDFDTFNHDDEDYQKSHDTVPAVAVPENSTLDETPSDAVPIENEVAEELSSNIENVSNTPAADSENSSATDQAETW